MALLAALAPVLRCTLAFPRSTTLHVFPERPALRCHALPDRHNCTLPAAREPLVRRGDLNLALLSPAKRHCITGTAPESRRGEPPRPRVRRASTSASAAASTPPHRPLLVLALPGLASARTNGPRWPFSSFLLLPFAGLPLLQCLIPFPQPSSQVPPSHAHAQPLLASSINPFVLPQAPTPPPSGHPSYCHLPSIPSLASA